MPAEDKTVEYALLSEVIEECSRQGVDRSAGLSILTTLISEAKRVQKAEPERAELPAIRLMRVNKSKKTNARATGLKVAVIGSSGGMGSFFVRYFVGRGHTVSGADIKPRPDMPPEFAFTQANSDAVKGADLVLVATPIDTTISIVRSLAHELPEGTVLIEISSVKEKIIPAITRLLRGRTTLLSIHPLFGPSQSATSGMKFMVLGKRNSLSAARRLFPEAELIPVSLEEHEKLVAFSLSLTHIMNMAYVSAISQKIGIDTFEKLATPTSSLQTTIAKAVLVQDPSLYSYIGLENKYSRVALDLLVKELRAFQPLLEKRARRRFEEKFLELAKLFSRSALQEALETVYGTGLN